MPMKPRQVAPQMSFSTAGSPRKARTAASVRERRVGAVATSASVCSAATGARDTSTSADAGPARQPGQGEADQLARLDRDQDAAPAGDEVAQREDGGAVPEPVEEGN